MSDEGEYLVVDRATFERTTNEATAAVKARLGAHPLAAVGMLAGAVRVLVAYGIDYDTLLRIVEFAAGDERKACTGCPRCNGAGGHVH